MAHFQFYLDNYLNTVIFTRIYSTSWDLLTRYWPWISKSCHPTDYYLCIPFYYYRNGTYCSTNATRVLCSNWIMWRAEMHQRWCGYVLVVWCLLHNKVIKITTESGCGWWHCAALLQHFQKLDYRCQTWMCPVAPRWPQGFNQPRGCPSSLTVVTNSTLSGTALLLKTVLLP